MSVVQLLKIDGDDFDGMTPDDMFQHFFEHILDDDLLTAGYFDDDEPDDLDDNLKLSQMIKYGWNLKEKGINLLVMVKY